MENVDEAQKNLNHHLLILRRSKQLTQGQMAELLNISTRAYSDLERGKHNLSLRTMLTLITVLSEQEAFLLSNDLRLLLRKGNDNVRT